MADGRGIGGAVKRVADHAKKIAALQAELAKAEIQQKAGKLGAGLGMLVAAALFGFFGFALALVLIIVALNIVLPLWLSVLIVFVLVLAVAGLLVLMGTRTLKRTGAPAPERAMAQMKLTADAFRGTPPGEAPGGGGPASPPAITRSGGGL
jgi:Flp pilus assembly protein TadB